MAQETPDINNGPMEPKDMQTFDLPPSTSEKFAEFIMENSTFILVALFLVAVGTGCFVLRKTH